MVFIKHKLYPTFNLNIIIGHLYVQETDTTLSYSRWQLFPSFRLRSTSFYSCLEIGFRSGSWVCCLSFRIRKTKLFSLDINEVKDKVLSYWRLKILVLYICRSLKKSSVKLKGVLILCEDTSKIFLGLPDPTLTPHLSLIHPKPNSSSNLLKDLGTFESIYTRNNLSSPYEIFFFSVTFKSFGDLNSKVKQRLYDTLSHVKRMGKNQN